MERDFMGFTVKQETPEDDEPIDAAPLRSTLMHWLFSSKDSGTAPRLLSFQDESPKTGFESLVSTGLVSLTTTDGFDSDHKPYTIVQTNAAVSPAQPFSAVPVTNPISAAPGDPIVGTTDLRNFTKISAMPAQLTIFYNGSVCIYDNILPAKAKAIMLLAGNGPSLSSSVISQPAAKPARLLISSSNFAESPKVGSAVGPVSSTFLPMETVPQFRQKSLARFLEKRRERTMINASPYGTVKKSPECVLSTDSSSSCPVLAIN